MRDSYGKKRLNETASSERVCVKRSEFNRAVSDYDANEVCFERLDSKKEVYESHGERGG